METQKFVIDIQEIKVAVDIVVFAYSNEKLYTLLIQRKYFPFEGQWAFPGGFFEETEEVEDAVLRELNEEAGVTSLPKIEQIGAFSKVKRDPRRRVISIAYMALINKLPNVHGETDASDARWINIDELPKPLAFDHDIIFEKALNILKDKIRYSTEAKEFISEVFTENELRTLYKLVLGKDFDEQKFREYVDCGYYVVKSSEGKLKFKTN